MNPTFKIILTFVLLLLEHGVVQLVHIKQVVASHSC